MVITNAENSEGAVLIVRVVPGVTVSLGLIAPRPAGMVTGIVNSLGSQQEAPLAKATIMASPLTQSDEPVSSISNGRPHLVAVTNLQGEYQLRGLPPGDYLITAYADGYIEGRQAVVVQARRAVAANFVLERASDTSGTVSGQVRSQGNPLPGVLVTLFRAFDGPSPGEPGPGRPIPLPQPIEVSATAAAGAAPGNPGVSRPIAPDQRPLFAVTDDQGRFQIEAVPTGNYIMIATKDGFSRGAHEVAVQANQITDVALELENVGGLLQGQITTTAGVAVAEASVSVFVNDPFLPIPGPVPPSEGSEGGFSSPGVTSDAAGIAFYPPERNFAVTNQDGRYSLTVEAGNYGISVFAKGHQPATSSVRVNVGQTTVADFRLIPGEPRPIPMPEPIGL